MLNGINIIGSIVVTRSDLRRVFDLHAAGKTRVIRETRTLDQVNDAIADVEAGKVAARIVFEPYAYSSPVSCEQSTHSRCARSGSVASADGGMSVPSSR